MISHYLVAANLGIMIFFSVAVAPGIFKHLPQEWAGVYVRKFFPKYYFFLGLVSMISSYYAQQTYERYLLLVVSVLFFFTLIVLTPMINNAKDGGRDKLFHTLHGISVLINFIEMAIFFYILI